MRDSEKGWNKCWLWDGVTPARGLSGVVTLCTNLRVRLLLAVQFFMNEARNKNTSEHEIRGAS